MGKVMQFQGILWDAVIMQDIIPLFANCKAEEIQQYSS
jgi:hypothetical protein